MKKFERVEDDCLMQISVKSYNDAVKRIEELELENKENISFIKQLYNLECTTSAFDYKCMMQNRIMKFKHRKSNKTK